MKQIDWKRIEDLMRRSITGSTMVDHEYDEIRVAYETDTKKYGELHTKVKRQETDKIRGSFG